MFVTSREFKKYTVKEHNAYLILALAKELSIPIYALIDYDEVEQEEIVQHIFIKVANYLFLDKMGVFKTPEERVSIDNFDFTRVEKMNYKKIKEKLVNQNFQVTNKETKKHYREWIRNHWLVINLTFGKEKEKWVYFGDDIETKSYFFVGLYESGVLNKYIHRISKEKFKTLEKGEIEFLERKQYKGSTMNEIFSKM